MNDSHLVMDRGKLAYRLKIKGKSMYPILVSGDMIVVNPNLVDLVPGVLVVYLNGKKVTVHRVIKRERENIITKGDWHRQIDEPVKRENLFGYCALIEKKWGSFRPLYIRWKAQGKVAAILSGYGAVLYQDQKKWKNIIGWLFLKAVFVLNKTSLFGELVIQRIKKAWI